MEATILKNPDDYNFLKKYSSHLSSIIIDPNKINI